MITHTLPSLSAWVSFLESTSFPVLSRSRLALQDLHARIDDIAAADLAHVIRHDALLALQVLRFLQTHQGRKPRADITSIERMVLMTGVEPVLKDCLHTHSVEDHLAQYPEALELVHRVMQRAHLASLCAESWAAQRHDIDTHEVMTAALMRDMAEILVGCVAPVLLLQMQALRQAEPTRRSQDIQTAVLGFPLLDLQLALVEQWHLPRTLQMLMDEHHQEHPRVRTVAVACRFARHVANGWDDPALPDDYWDAAEICGTTPDAVKHRIIPIAQRAGQDWEWFGTQPASALLPSAPD